MLSELAKEVLVVAVKTAAVAGGTVAGGYVGWWLGRTGYDLARQVTGYPKGGVSEDLAEVLGGAVQETVRQVGGYFSRRAATPDANGVPDGKPSVV